MENDDKKKKKYGLIEALKSKYGKPDDKNIMNVIKEKGAKGLPDREIKKKKGFFD